MSKRITHARIINVIGIDELEFDAGDITIIEGRNQAGKSSAIRAIKAVLGGGHDAKLIRQGADEAEAVLIISEGDDEIEATKTIKPSGSRLKVSPRPVSGGQQGFLDAMQDSFGLNPVDIIDNQKGRAEIILSALNLKIDMDALGEAVSVDGKQVVRPPHAVAKGVGALDVIDSVRKDAYQERTDVNRDAKKSRQRIEDLRASLSDEAPDVEGLQEWIADLDRQRDELEERLKEIAVQRQKYVSRIEAANREESARKLLESETADAEAAESKSENLTTVIAQLDELKTKMAEKIPFGISFDDSGEVFVDGVPFETLNTQAQIDTAMKIATLRTGELPLIIVDGIERLDADHQDALVAWAEKTDAQFILTRVTDSDLTVKTKNRNDEPGR